MDGVVEMVGNEVETSGMSLSISLTGGSHVASPDSRDIRSSDITKSYAAAAATGSLLESIAESSPEISHQSLQTNKYTPDAKQC